MKLSSRNVRTVASADVKPFAVTQTPFPGESLVGYISRSLAETPISRLATGLSLAGIGTGHAEFIASTLDDPQQIADLAKLLGVGEAEILHRLNQVTQGAQYETFHHFGLQLHGRLKTSVVRRIAPTIMKRANFHRAVWYIAPLSFDPETRETLLDRCPECKHQLGWRRCRGISMCDQCVNSHGGPAVDLRDFPQPIVEVHDAEALQFVTDLVSHDGLIRETATAHASKDWDAAGPAELFTFTCTLASYLEADSAVIEGVDPKDAVSGFNAPRSLNAHALATIGRVMMGGRKALGEFLDERRATLEGTVAKKSFERCYYLGCVPFALKNKRVSSSLRNVLQQALKDHRQRKPFDRRMGGGDGHFVLKDAAKMLSLPAPLINALVNQEVIDCQRRKDRRMKTYVSPDNMLAQLPILADLITTMGALKALSVSKEDLRSLARHGLITELADPLLDPFFRQPIYSRASIESLLDRLIKLPRGQGGTNIDVAWGAGFKLNCVRAAAIAAILDPSIGAIKTGDGEWCETIAIFDVPKFQQTVHETIKSWTSSVPIGGMTSVQVASKLGIANPTLSELHQAGFLVRSRPNWYSTEAVSSFTNKYILGTEIRRNHRLTNNMQMRTLLQRLHLKRETGPKYYNRVLVVDRVAYQEAISTLDPKIERAPGDLRR
jgi:hypothetical protein